jgi:hypothetical protein
MTRIQSRWSRLRGVFGAALVVTLGALALGSGRAEAEFLTGLTSTGNLMAFDSATPGTISVSVAITGLQAGETLLGIDRRPANGLLYGRGSTSRVYTIDCSRSTWRTARPSWSGPSAPA